MKPKYLRIDDEPSTATLIQYCERKLRNLAGIPKDRMKCDRYTSGSMFRGIISRMVFPPLTDEEWDNFKKNYENDKNREICQHK